jgi:hypothetical protein
MSPADARRRVFPVIQMAQRWLVNGTTQCPLINNTRHIEHRIKSAFNCWLCKQSLMLHVDYSAYTQSLDNSKSFSQKLSARKHKYVSLSLIKVLPVEIIYHGAVWYDFIIEFANRLLQTTDVIFISESLPLYGKAPVENIAFTLQRIDHQRQQLSLSKIIARDLLTRNSMQTSQPCLCPHAVILRVVINLFE